jgi:hypothetical protein
MMGGPTVLPSAPYSWFLLNASKLSTLYTASISKWWYWWFPFLESRNKNSFLYFKKVETGCIYSIGDHTKRIMYLSLFWIGQKKRQGGWHHLQLWPSCFHWPGTFHCPSSGAGSCWLQSLPVSTRRPRRSRARASL